MNANELACALRQFTGTDHWYRHPLNRNMLYTDGVKYFADNAGNGAYWFLDICATELYELQAEEGFISVWLDVQDDKAMIAADDGNDKDLYSKTIEYTDCPPGEWKFFFTDKVLLLTSEY